MATIVNPLTNQNESGIVRDDPRADRQRRLTPGRIVREMAPLVPRAGHLDFAGLFAARAANNRTIVRDYGYAGVAPAFLQPQIKKPNPWSDPTRGRP